MSLKHKILCYVSFFLILCLGLVFLIMRNGYEDLLAKHQRKVSEIIYHDLSKSIKSDLSNYYYLEIESLVDNYAGNNDIEFLAVFDDVGRLISYYSNNQNELYRYINRVVDSEKNRPEKNTFRYEKYNNKRYLIFQKEIINFGEVVGYIKLAVSDAEIKKIYGSMFGTLVTLFLVLAAFFFFCITFVISSMMKPIDSLEHIVSNENQSIEDLNLKDIVKFKETEYVFEQFLSLKRKIQDFYKEKQNHEIDRIKNQIARQVAHDVRSPIAAFKSILQLNDVGLNGKVKKLLFDSVERIEEIVQSLEFEEKEYDLNSVGENYSVKSELEKIVDEIKLQVAGEKIVQFSICIHEECEERLVIDRVKFKRIMSNLLVNSIESFEMEGKIIVRVYPKACETVVLEVVDNGCGIPEFVKRNVFSSGFTYGKQRGSGLGLAYVKKIVEDFGGVVSVESELKLGTSVKIILPSSNNPPGSWVLGLVEGKKIVIIDDDHRVHESWRILLEKKISRVCQNLEASFFYDPSEFSGLDMAGTDHGYQFFVDDCFRDRDAKGSDWIAENELEISSVLITGEASGTVLERYRSRGIRIVNKENMNLMIAVNMNSV
ncbi:MAG: HAMP domain-containing sensor histidine kinase [Bdellovibrionota bacterium]